MPRHHILPLIAGVVFASWTVAARSAPPDGPPADAAKPAAAEYHIYAGNTHAHTSYTWSHGEHLGKTGCAGILVYARNPVTNVLSWSEGYVKSQTGCACIFVIDGAQIPGPDTPVKPDWEKFQGPPSKHYS